ncbi:MAG TPA: MupA/Atu3671 family FMN-dependent luciferase-like monooxygenase [Jatrophihabitans sp.]|nr:MupA/Atu3671 family FMN-dependent luciferase-like monooxygenase [Jatrophihabitans sp.]
MRFGLMFFAAPDGAAAGETYQTMLAAARTADRAGLAAVWTPERHFDRFGGVFPNPAVTSAALAVATERLQLRAGSLISPLHNTVRIAEDWSTVDNLSGGRVAISFGAGWNVNDFVLNPDRYPQRREVMLAQLDQVRALWRGETVELPNGLGNSAQVALYPRPVQAELPVWLTSSGNPQTFADAGSRGANLLTHLIGQDLPELAGKIELYRKARADAGLDPSEGIVSLMLHTHLRADADLARQVSRVPFREYLRSAVVLETKSAKGGGTISGGHASPGEDLPEDLLEDLLDLTCERYLSGGSLIGSAAGTLPLVGEFRAAGVDEVACLVDFGLSGADLLAGLPELVRLAELAG